MVDNSNKHTHNGLVQNRIALSTGFEVSVSIATGVNGESTCICIYDRNCYDDSDSRSQRPKEFIIPIDYADDLQDISDLILKSLKERKKSLKKSSK